MPKFRTRLTVALVSAIVIALELMLMRILSIRFWHHLSYLVIATALLGFGAAGTLLTLFRRAVAGRLRGALFVATLLFALVIPIAVRASEYVPLDVQQLPWSPWDQVGHLALLSLILLAPLLLGGTVVGLALMDDPDRIPGHYAANLVGSGAGAVLAILLMQFLPTPQIMMVLPAGAWLAGLVSVPRPRWAAVPAAVAVAGALVAVHWFRPWAPSMSEEKTLCQLKLAPGTRTIAQAEGPLGRIDVVAGPAVHLTPALSLSCPEPIPPHAAMIVDGDQASAIYQTREPADFAFLDWTTSALPYAMLTTPAVLVIGAGGGGDIGLAKYHGSRRVVALEMNPQVIELMTGELRDRGGDIYLAPGVEVLPREARGYLAGGGERFDLIQVPAAGSSAAAAAGVQAGRVSHLYTVEAFEQMLDRLLPGGMVCVTTPTRTPPRDGFRVLAIADEALRRRMWDSRRHLAMIRSPGSVSLILFDSAVTERRLDAIEKFCEARKLDLCFLPGMTFEKANRFHVLERAYYYYGAEVILGEEHYSFLANYAFDVRPTTDDRPYFFHFFRWRAWPLLREKLKGLSPTLLELGYLLLVATLVQCVPVSLILILLPLAGRARVLRGETGKARAFGYFLLIGLGFMFVEMSFLQRLTVYLASPIYSAAVVIAAFLVFAGIGSRLSLRWRKPAETVIIGAGVVVVAVTLLYMVVMRNVLVATQHWGVYARAALAVVLVAPLAVAMGHMFPTALRRLGASHPAMVPWCWAINGFASVVATLAATLLAMGVGFMVVAAAGAGAYLLAFAVCVERPKAEGPPQALQGRAPARRRG